MRTDCTPAASFFFNDTASTEIYTLSLHDALPIFPRHRDHRNGRRPDVDPREGIRSEEHTSELQSRQYLVCRLLLEKKNQVHRLVGGGHAHWGDRCGRTGPEPGVAAADRLLREHSL